MKHSPNNNALITELKKFVDQQAYQQVGHKALRVYVKCIRNGKTELAKAIHVKYGFRFPNDDLTTSLGIAIMAAKVGPTIIPPVSGDSEQTKKI